MSCAEVNEQPAPPPVRTTLIVPLPVGDGPENDVFAGVTATVPDATLGPAAFVAMTEHVYIVLFESPETTIGDAVFEAVKPPGMQVAVKLVIALPFAEPGVKLIVAAPLLGKAVPMTGAAGTVNGVTETVPDGPLVPMPLVAVTEHVYVVPFVSPITVIGDPAGFVPVMPLHDAV